MTEELTDDQVEELATRIVELTEQIKELGEAKDELSARLRDGLKVGTNRPFGARTVTVRQAARFDPAKARVLMTEEQITFCTVTKSELDKAIVERILPPAAFDACKAPFGKATVVVK